MAHQQQRARELQQQLLEQVERLDVEVVGRLVQHQHVGRLGEEPGQQQPVPLAAGQRPHRRARPLRREEEVLQVAEDVLARAADLHEVGAVRDAVEHGRVRIELLAQLVEVRDLEAGALADAPAVRRELAEQQAEQGGLARAVGADEPDAVAAR